MGPRLSTLLTRLVHLLPLGENPAYIYIQAMVYTTVRVLGSLSYSVVILVEWPYLGAVLRLAIGTFGPRSTSPYIIGETNFNNTSPRSTNDLLGPVFVEDP